MLNESDLLSTLESEQLADAKKRPIPRRRLKTWETALLWFLRIYVLFMAAVVIYQIVSGGQ